MKRKSLFLPGATLIKWHAVIYIGFIVALWAALAAALFNSPSSSVFALNSDLIVSRVWLTIFWGLVFLAHFAVQEVRGWRQNRARQSHLRVVSEIQERYVSSSHLDLDQTNEEDLLIDEESWTAQRLQSK